MSNRKRVTRTRQTQIPRCGRCEAKPAAHVIAVPPMQGAGGYELLACEGCWPALQLAVAQVFPAAVIGECGCGEC